MADLKILLINAPFNYNKTPAVMPSALLNLGTILKISGYSVKIIDLNAEKQYEADFLPNPLNAQEFIQKVKKFNPEIVGISSFTENYKIAMTIAQMVKNENENVKVMYGGFHATFQANECLKNNPSIDLVVLGESEHLIIEIIEGLAGKKDLDRIDNIAFRKNRIIKAKSELSVPNLSEIPLPDLSLLKDKFYPSFLLHLEYSRGCPFQCAFCAISPISKRKVRFFPIKRVLDQLESYSEYFDNFSCNISDATFLLHPKKVKMILEEVRNRKIELNEWTFQTRVDTVNREFLKEIKKHNVSSFSLGIEDIHDSVLQTIGKTQTFAQTQKAIKIMKELDFRTIGTFVIGLPSQTKQHMLENIEFSSKLDFVTFSSIVPFPGSLIFNSPEAFGLSIISKDWEQYDLRELVMDSITFPIEEQRIIRDLAWKQRAKIHLDKGLINYYEISEFQRLLEIGYDQWNREWKTKHASGWH